MIEQILSEVATVTRVPINAMRGRSRQAPLVRARQIAAWIAVHQFGIIHQSVADALSKDRTSVTHALRVARDRVRLESQFSQQAKVVLARLQNTNT